MHANTFHLPDNKIKIGDIMTPLQWGKFAVEKFQIFDKWIDGATIFDPSMGTANLLASLIAYGLEKGYSLSNLPIYSLYGNELNVDYYNESLLKFSSLYKVNMESNFWNMDVFDIQTPGNKFDILFGNPPWANFTDLPFEYKEYVKQKFLEYDLVEDKQKLLLGGSRIDIAGLVIQKSMKDFLKTNGNAYFFIPLSLLLNEGCNNYFRKYKVNGIQYSLEKVYDFNEMDVFHGISTRYGLVYFKKG